MSKIWSDGDPVSFNQTASASDNSTLQMRSNLDCMLDPGTPRFQFLFPSPPFLFLGYIHLHFMIDGIKEVTPINPPTSPLTTISAPTPFPPFGPSHYRTTALGVTPTVK
jgi:hypothetical protein